MQRRRSRRHTGGIGPVSEKPRGRAGTVIRAKEALAIEPWKSQRNGCLGPWEEQQMYRVEGWAQPRRILGRLLKVATVFSQFNTLRKEEEGET